MKDKCYKKYGHPNNHCYFAVISRSCKLLQSLCVNMYKLRAPLNKLLKKGAMWNWSNECQKSFENIKKMLTSELSLMHFNHNLEIMVTLDDSNYGIGAVIYHKFTDGKTKAVVNASRMLIMAEQNYSQI